MENRDWQKDMERVENFKFAQTLCNGIQPMFHGQFSMPEPIEVALEYWLQQVKQLKEDNARWTCQYMGAEQKYLTQANVISEFKEREQKLRGGMEEVYELSKHDGESRYLDKCYVVARGILRSLYPLDKEDTNEMDTV